MIPDFLVEALPFCPRRRLGMMMGSETEYGILDGWTLERAESIQREVLKRCAHLPAVKEGVFLDNGARVYVDQGKQNEYATPEVQSPSDLVVRELAGRRLMSECAGCVGLSLLCSNVDPERGTTWGTHENYECRRKPFFYNTRLLYPHLVTRILFSGAGGLDPGFRGVRAVLSPRACLTTASFGCQGVPCKSLVFAKPDAYCDGFRMHVLCGESLLSDTASYLKYATTALVAYGIDQNLNPGPGMFACDPICALKTLNRDVSLCSKFPMNCGRSLTAFEIQQKYLDDIEREIDAYPEWAPLAVRHWRQVLDDLKCGRHACARQVDWLFFRVLLGELAAEYDYDWDALRTENARLAENREMSASGRFDELRSAAQALYVRLHVVGERSLFDVENERLDPAAYDHRLPDIDDASVRRAVSEPPPGRAENRVALIRKYGGAWGCYIGWDVFSDVRHARQMAIPRSSAWHRREEWVNVAQSIAAKANIATLAFRRGEYRSVVSLLEPVFQTGDIGGRAKSCSDLCLSYARMGMRDDAEKLLSTHDGIFRDAYERAVFALFCAVNYGLCPPRELTVSLIQQCRQAGRRSDLFMEAGYDSFVFDQCLALFFISQGDFAAAEQLCRNMLVPRDTCSRTRMMARTRCLLAKALYFQGRCDEARVELDLAVKCHQDEQLLWDRAEFSLPLEAALAADHREAFEKLVRAEEVCRTLDNPLSLARTLCLKARMFRWNDGLEEIRRLCAATAALRDCPFAARVMREWGVWVQGPEGESGPDDRWGL